MQNKRGQFYLIAAFAIVSVLIGLATVANSLKSQESTTDIYDISEELEIESGYVLDYATKNNLDEHVVFENFADTFTENYPSDDFYFIFGKEGNLDAYKYLNGTKSEIDYDLDSGVVSININSVDYSFNLTTGENFYYVIYDDKNEEKYIVSG